MKKIGVSVILPVYNGEQYLKESIKSILCQSYRYFELILVSDASTDRTAEIIGACRDSRIVVINNRVHLGVARSLNRGLRRAQGVFICRMDADDIAMKRRLEKQVAYLSTHPQIGVLGSWVRLIDAKGLKKGFKKYPTTDLAIRRMLPFANPFIHPSVMIRGALFKKAGDYRPEIEGAEDYELWFRLAQYTKFRNLPEYLLEYRLHRENVSFKHTANSNLAYARIQLLKVRKYGYPFWHLIFALKGLISMMIPRFVIQRIYTRYFNY